MATEKKQLYTVTWWKCLGRIYDYDRNEYKKNVSTYDKICKSLAAAIRLAFSEWSNGGYRDVIVERVITKRTTRKTKHSTGGETVRTTTTESRRTLSQDEIDTLLTRCDKSREI